MAPTGFELAIPENDGPRALTLDRSANGFGNLE